MVGNILNGVLKLKKKIISYVFMEKRLVKYIKLAICILFIIFAFVSKISVIDRIIISSRKNESSYNAFDRMFAHQICYNNQTDSTSRFKSGNLHNSAGFGIDYPPSTKYVFIFFLYND